MKTISTTLKVSLLSLALLFMATQSYANADDFCVKVKEKPVPGSVAQTQAELICIGGHNGYTVPCFNTMDDGTAMVNFDIEYWFNVSPVPNGTVAEIRANVYTLDVNGNPVYLPLLNAAPGQNYVVGQSDVVVNGAVTLEIDLHFDVPEDCLYYFETWLANVTPVSTGSGSSGNSGGISQGPIGGALFALPDMSLRSPVTRCEESCIITYPDIVPICIAVDGEPGPYPHDRISSNGSEDLSIYPNPTTDGYVILDIDFGQTDAEAMDIRVLDTQGRSVFLQKGLKMYNKQRLNLTDLTPGIYFVYVKAGDQMLVEKMVMQ